jgi:hypothetical protein
VSAAGALLFGRYAFPPNRLGYCGPDDQSAPLEYVAGGRPDRGLVELERRFEGAYPYLAPIALANRIPRPVRRARGRGVLDRQPAAGARPPRRSTTR